MKTFNFAETFNNKDLVVSHRVQSQNCGLVYVYDIVAIADANELAHLVVKLNVNCAIIERDNKGFTERQAEILCQFAESDFSPVEFAEQITSYMFGISENDNPMLHVEQDTFEIFYETVSELDFYNDGIRSYYK